MVRTVVAAVDMREERTARRVCDIEEVVGVGVVGGEDGIGVRVASRREGMRWAVLDGENAVVSGDSRRRRRLR